MCSERKIAKLAAKLTLLHMLMQLFLKVTVVVKNALGEAHSLTMGSKSLGADIVYAHKW